MSKDRIAFAFITSYPDRLTGLSSYTESLVVAMSGLVDTSRLLLITNASPEIFPRLRHAGIEWVQIPPRPRRVPYKLYCLLAHEYASLWSRRNGVTRYISTTPIGAAVPLVPQHITIHDLYDTDRTIAPLRTVAYTAVLWRWLSLVSARVICVSSTTASEANRFLPRAATQKIAVVKEASRFSIEEVRPYREPARFLFVANVQPVKNVECLLEAIELARGAVTVDWIGWDVHGIVERWVARRGAPRGFHVHGSVSEAELRRAYRDAYALIVPSWIEGFCLPILEAQAFGTPVIASDIPILREVAGEGAMFFDPRDPRELLRAMQTLLGNRELRQRLSVSAQQNARQFSWDKAARETLELLRCNVGPAEGPST